MSAPQKYRHRQRMRRVDRIVDCVDNALKKQGVTIEAVERWKAEMPTEAEMEPKDKYTIFARNERGYRKGLHSGFSSWDVGRSVEANDVNRGTKMDEGQPAGQSPGFLEWEGKTWGERRVYIMRTLH